MTKQEELENLRFECAQCKRIGPNCKGCKTDKKIKKLTSKLGRRQKLEALK